MTNFQTGTYHFPGMILLFLFLSIVNDEIVRYSLRLVDVKFILAVIHRRDGEVSQHQAHPENPGTYYKRIKL